VISSRELAGTTSKSILQSNAAKQMALICIAGRVSVRFPLLARQPAGFARHAAFHLRIAQSYSWRPQQALLPERFARVCEPNIA